MPKYPRRPRDQYTAPNSKYIGAECSPHQIKVIKPPPPLHLPTLPEKNLKKKN